MLGLIVTILISQHAAGEAKERVVQRRSVQSRAALGCILRQSKGVTCDAGDPVRERPVFSWFNAMVPTYLVHLGTQQMGFVASASALGIRRLLGRWPRAGDRGFRRAVFQLPDHADFRVRRLVAGQW
ncbi:hypothetical protein OKW34_003615 [Paraburkholderia youngii]|uniref:hypothetical protein n=1 Tax=Paraburkholderia youngii TaxID=2782701 RepID=UPI003D192A06